MKSGTGETLWWLGFGEACGERDKESCIPWALLNSGLEPTGPGATPDLRLFTGPGAWRESLTANWRHFCRGQGWEPSVRAFMGLLLGWGGPGRGRNGAAVPVPPGGGLRYPAFQLETYNDGALVSPSAQGCCVVTVF